VRRESFREKGGESRFSDSRDSRFFREVKGERGEKRKDLKREVISREDGKPRDFGAESGRENRNGDQERLSLPFLCVENELMPKFS